APNPAKAPKPIRAPTTPTPKTIAFTVGVDVGGGGGLVLAGPDVDDAVCVPVLPVDIWVKDSTVVGRTVDEVGGLVKIVDVGGMPVPVPDPDVIEVVVEDIWIGHPPLRCGPKVKLYQGT
ncbi:hypothetical protein HDU76_008525, partial [Blyttiomyces sp. JEL0837]